MLRGALRRLLGVWIVEVRGVRVATKDSEEEALQEAGRLESVADGAEVVVRHVWRDTAGERPKGGRT